MENYTKKIRKTGFVLENKIAETFRRDGWSLISNKYYEDDFEGSVREIDLLAYKVSRIEHIDLYTTILVSCKKSDTKDWALLARDINLNDPNSNFWPFHAWSNDKAISFELSNPNVAKDYHEKLISLGVKEALSMPEHEVFAFQEMDRKSGAPRNDCNIFSSLTSLMKAQAYELGVLNHRKKTPSIYQFNLISIIDSELIRLMFDGDNISQISTESEHYISRYIIKKKENFSRIRFIKASCFEDKLKDYTTLHKANCQWFNLRYNTFYNEVLQDPKRTNIFIKEFRKKIDVHLFLAIRRVFDTHPYPKAESENIWLQWNNESNYLTIEVYLEDRDVTQLNDDSQLVSEVASILKDIYHYDGKFRFEEDSVPF